MHVPTDPSESRKKAEISLGEHTTPRLRLYWRSGSKSRANLLFDSFDYLRKSHTPGMCI